MNLVAILIVGSVVATVGATWFEKSVNKGCWGKTKKYRKVDFAKKEIFQIRREMSRLQKEITDLKTINCKQNKTGKLYKFTLM